MAVLASFLLAIGGFGACEEAFAQAPDPSQAYMCFYFTAQSTKSWDEGERLVTRLIERFPDRRHWLELVRGHILSERDEKQAEASYLAAAEGFARTAVAEGEVLARNNLTRILQGQQRYPEAEREIDRVLEVAERSGNAALIARARISEADYLSATGRDVARAYRALKRAEAVAFPDGPHGLKRRCLEALGQVAFAMGRLDESIEAYGRLLEILREDGDTFTAAMMTFNMADARYRKLEHLPDPREREEVIALLSEALSLAEASENRSAEAYARQLLLEITPRRSENREAIRAHGDRCIAIAKELDHPDRIASCLWALGESLADLDAEAAESLMNEALRVAVDSGSNWYVAYAWRSRARLSWKTKPFEAAAADARAALEAVESLRRLQDEERGRIELFSDWTQDYYGFSGRLLRASDPVRAFDVIERMRARALLESLTASSPKPPEDPARARALAEIAKVQRRLLDPALLAAERARTLDELEQLELDEAELRPKHGLSEGDAPVFASLEEVQKALRENEAMVSFQVALSENLQGDYGGGAWALLVAKDGARAFGIPDRVALEPKVPVFLGLIARGDGSESGAAARLFDDLLGEALRSLSPQVDELVIVPDGILHQLPFTALRMAGVPLGERIALTVAPSATLWLRWREAPPAAAEVPALAVADPALTTDASSITRNLDFREGAGLGSLPHAREEGRTVVRRLGGGSELLIAGDASERDIKHRDLTRYGILHFAAHALADDQNPDRSAVVLSPGADGEDGLLQVREIGELDLEGRIVVLSACRTAWGRTLNGEGVQSLARAFLRAGAHAVVASRWPLRDDEAAILFDDFYRALGSGASLAQSLRIATEKAVNAGLPVSAWSALTLYGDGSLVPIASRNGAPLAPIVGGLALLAALFFLSRRVGRGSMG